MEGFVLAAGLGTRLRPLTDHRPKALVEVGGVPLLQLVIDRMVEAGVGHIVVNIHHFGDQIVDYLASHPQRAEVTVSDERRCLMDTGGALAQAAPLFGGVEPVLVHNVDIVSDIDFGALEACHREGGHLATLCVSRRATSRQLVFSRAGRLKGRQGEVEVAEDDRVLAFSGVSLVSAELFRLLPPASAGPYPIIPHYVELAREHAVNCFEHPADHWLDVGRLETLNLAQQWKHSFTK